jgi:hypothetical protein
MNNLIKLNKINEYVCTDRRDFDEIINKYTSDIFFDLLDIDDNENDNKIIYKENEYKSKTLKFSEDKILKNKFAEDGDDDYYIYSNNFFIYYNVFKFVFKDVKKIFVSTFYLPVIKYSYKQELTNCYGYKCRRYEALNNCTACHGDRNEWSSYRRNFPRAYDIHPNDIPYDAINYKVELVHTEQLSKYNIDQQTKYYDLSVICIN